MTGTDGEAAEARDEIARATLRRWGAGELRALAGDASTRRYLRGRLASGRGVVVMDCGEALPGVRDGRDGFAFTRWQAFYRGLGIRVPEILDLDREAGLVLLEDLGDELLQFRVEALGPAACEAAYRRAVHWGRVLAEAGAAAYDPARDPDEDPLVAPRLALEMDLFLVHAARAPLPAESASLPPLRRAARALDEAEPGGALGAARALLHALCADASAASPLAPCHRDYHARNLILVSEGGSEEVAVIDFQDTRRGPRAYDLASLAWDPYVTLPDDMIARLVEAWRPEGVARDAWQAEVGLAAGQRLVKAAGSYAWLSGERGKPEYARWLAPALRRAHDRLAAWPLRDALWQALGAAGALGADAATRGAT